VSDNISSSLRDWQLDGKGSEGEKREGRRKEFSRKKDAIAFPLLSRDLKGKLAKFTPEPLLRVFFHR